MRRVLEGGVHLVGIAEVIIERDVVRDMIVKLRRAGFGRFFGVGDRGQGIDIDLDGLGGIAGLHQRLGDDESHGIADKADLVGH